jgi:hypothetical protein
MLLLLLLLKGKYFAWHNCEGSDPVSDLTFKSPTIFELAISSY